MTRWSLRRFLRELKEELQRSDINMSEVIRSGLENALKERKIEQLEESASTS